MSRRKSNHKIQRTTVSDTQDTRDTISPLKPLYMAMAISAGLGVAAPAAFAQDGTTSANTLRLEEVIVTAQKRVEALQEVPLSVSAVDGAKIDQAGVENIEDLTMLLPNLHFTESGFSTQVRVRGVGSDNSQGFEQSVGMYVDGIYHGRAQLFRAPMMDMERVELLRGPQSTLFGKNSIAGALNLTTARPTDEFEGLISASHEFEFKTREINAMVSGPITDSIRGRLAVRTYEDDGYVFNSFTNTDEPFSDEQTIRGSLEWSATENLEFYLKVEKSEFDTRGRSIEITQDQPAFATFADALEVAQATNTDVDPSDVSFFGSADYNDILQVNSLPGFDDQLDYRRQTNISEFSNNEVDNISFIAEYSLGEYTITATTGLLEYNYEEKCDCDFTPANLLELDLFEDYEQFSQEIRIASPQGGRVEWLAGIFYQTYEQNFQDSLFIRADNALPDLNSDLEPVRNTSNIRAFQQDSDDISIFARATFEVTPELFITVGGRFSDEDKSATKSINLTEVDGVTILEPSLATETTAAVYLDAFRLETEQLPAGAGGHNLAEERSDSQFTPTLIAEYDYNDDIMIYGSLSQGTKAGGYDPRSNQSGSFGFEDERATALEIGTKTTLADGRGELNVALYRTVYDDLQFSQFDGGVGFNVGNIAETVVQGIEIDGRWKLSEVFTLNYGASFLDFEYTDFENGNCFVGRTPDGISAATGTSICDYTSERGVATPDVTFNTSVDFFKPISPTLNLVGFVDWQYVAGHQIHVNLDPQGEIDAYNMVSARIGVDAENWNVSLLAKNLLDEEVITYSANLPLSDSNFATNSYYSFVRRPFTVALEASYRF